MSILYEDISISILQVPQDNFLSISECISYKFLNHLFMKTIRYQQYHVTLSKNTFTSVNYGIICALNVTRLRSISCLTFFSPGKTIFHDLCNNLSSDVSRFELYRLLAGACDRCLITRYTFLILSKLIKYYTCSIVCFH